MNLLNTWIAVGGAMMALSLPLAGIQASEQHGHGAAHAPYAGLEQREIKSLSESDIEQLREGRGWGLALPAELNGYPGPVHLIELKDQLGLSAEQTAELDRMFKEMQAEAVAGGKRMIAAEQALDAAFVSGNVDGAELRRLIAEAEAARAELRYVHLSRHLATPALLTAEQIERYQALRGYRADPCAKVPEGHDPAMWRKHNGCE